MIRRLWGRDPNLAIFCFHAVIREPLPVEDGCWIPLAIFERQLEALTRRYQVVRLQDALDSLWQGGLKRRTAVLTFDDGFRNSYDVVLPTLRRYGLPATMFLTTQPIRRGGMPLWFSRLHHAICRTNCREIHWRGEVYPLRSSAERVRASGTFQRLLKTLEPAEVDSATDELTGWMGVEDPCTTNSNFATLDAAAVRAMALDGIFDFGAHTCTHPILSRLPVLQQRDEIEGSIGDVAELTGTSPLVFAYPNGQPSDFTLETEQILKARGMRAAFSAVQRHCTPADGRFRIPRRMMGPKNWEWKLQ